VSDCNATGKKREDKYKTFCFADSTSKNYFFCFFFFPVLVCAWLVHKRRQQRRGEVESAVHFDLHVVESSAGQRRAPHRTSRTESTAQAQRTSTALARGHVSRVVQ
jgi:hypothetical protein